jgi:lysosomal acid phosphatase
MITINSQKEILIMLKKYWLAVGLIFCIPSISFAAEKLVFALDLIRHGDRTPVFSMPAVDYKWSEGLGQLTAEGMRQEFELGQAFRKRYIETEHLLPEHYQHGTMYVRSTDYERTLMSAQSLLMGMYPAGTGPVSDEKIPGLPNSLQPIPVHSAPVQQDKVILHRLSSAQYSYLMKKYVYSTPEWQLKERELSPQFKRWSEASGMSITSLAEVNTIADTLFVHQQHHIPMPAGLSEEDIKTIIAAGDWAFMAEERPYPVARANSHQLAMFITQILVKSSKPDARLKYVLLSAHDSTLASMMSLLGVPLLVTPHYASDLNFALYEGGGKGYTVKITYNDELVTVPACGGTTCTLRQIVNLMK